MKVIICGKYIPNSNFQLELPTKAPKALRASWIKRLTGEGCKGCHVLVSYDKKVIILPYRYGVSAKTIKLESGVGFRGDKRTMEVLDSMLECSIFF